MITDAEHATTIFVTLTLRHLRRFVPFPFLRPLVAMIAVVVVVSVACGVGVWAGFVLNELAVAANTAAGAVIFMSLITGIGSGAVWGEMRAGLVELSSWRFYAERGVSPRSFLVGRHLMSRLVRLVTGLCLMLTTLVVLAITQDGGAGINGVAWSASVFTGIGAAACGISFALLRAASPLRCRRLVVAVTVAIVSFSACAVSWLWQWGISVVLQLGMREGISARVNIPEVSTAALAITAMGTVAVALLSYRALGKLSWADVNERVERIGLAASHRASLPGGYRRLAELMLLDVRRALRSFEWRVRPGLFTGLAMLSSIVALGILASWQFHDIAVDFSESAVGATLIGGICAGCAFTVFFSFAPLVSLDSGRGATTLMRSLPGGIRAMVLVRVSTGAIVTALAGTTFIVVLALCAPIGPRSLGSAATACLAIAVAAPVTSTFVSLRYPQPNWKESIELGQLGWARAIANYGAGMAIAVALSLASGVAWSYLPAIVVVALLIFVAPIIAAGIAFFLPTTIGVSAHA